MNDETTKKLQEIRNRFDKLEEAVKIKDVAIRKIVDEVGLANVKPRSLAHYLLLWGLFSKSNVIDKELRRELEESNPWPFFILLRHQLEMSATVNWVLKNEDVEKIAFGTKPYDKEDKRLGMPIGYLSRPDIVWLNIPHIMDLIREMDKEIRKKRSPNDIEKDGFTSIEAIYGLLSDLCHPNAFGLHLFFNSAARTPRKFTTHPKFEGEQLDYCTKFYIEISEFLITALELYVSHIEEKIEELAKRV